MLAVVVVELIRARLLQRLLSAELVAVATVQLELIQQRQELQILVVAVVDHIVEQQAAAVLSSSSI
jgi:hypothetical protein